MLVAQFRRGFQLSVFLAGVIFTFTPARAAISPHDQFNLVLASQLQRGAVSPELLQALNKSSPHRETLAEAINFLKAHRTDYLVFARDEYFCRLTRGSTLCWKPAGRDQIQFEGATHPQSIWVRPMAPDLKDKIQFRSPTAHLPKLNFQEVANAESEENQIERWNRQLGLIQQTLDADYERCRQKAKDKGDLGACINHLEDKFALEDAANAARLREVDRLNASLMLMTNEGWKLEEAVVHQLFQAENLVKMMPTSTYACAASTLKVGSLTISPTTEPDVNKIVASNGTTYLAGVARSNHLSQNKCNYEPRPKGLFDSCRNGTSIANDKGLLWDSCWILDFNCKLKTPGDVLNVAMCENPDCKKLLPVNYFQARTALTASAKLSTESAETQFEIQKYLLVNQYMASCCKDAKCRQHAETNFKLHLTPGQAPSPQTIPPPPEKGTSVNERGI